MSITLQISDEAWIAYLKLLEWYCEIDLSLGMKFSDEYISTIKKIYQNPTHYSFIAPNIRRCLFPKMQCMLLYEFENNTIIILLVKDTRSKPSKNFY
jgi:hypothetical protein